MPGDLERQPAPVSQPCSARAAQCLWASWWAEVRAELPVVGGLGEREQLLVSAWLTGLRSARTRRGYADDVVAWLTWLAERGKSAAAWHWSAVAAAVDGYVAGFGR